MKTKYKTWFKLVPPFFIAGKLNPSGASLKLISPVLLSAYLSPLTTGEGTRVHLDYRYCDINVN